MLGVSYVEDDKTIIRVISCKEKNLIAMIDDFENMKFTNSFIRENESYITNLTFDRNYKYLVGYGSNNVLIMNLVNGKVTLKEIPD